jgi:hypothetical protein
MALVRLKVAEPGTAAALATTAYVPVCPFAVNAGAVATPLALVTAVAAPDPAKEAPAPLAGTVNVTVTPPTGLLPASFTVACNAVANAVFMVAV